MMAKRQYPQHLFTARPSPIHGPSTALRQRMHSPFTYYCSTLLNIVEEIHASFLSSSTEAKRDHVLARSRDMAFLAAICIHIEIIAVYIHILGVRQDIFIRSVRVGHSARSGQRTMLSMLLAVVHVHNNQEHINDIVRYD